MAIRETSVVIDVVGDWWVMRWLLWVLMVVVVGTRLVVVVGMWLVVLAS